MPEFPAQDAQQRSKYKLPEWLTEPIRYTENIKFMDLVHIATLVVAGIVAYIYWGQWQDMNTQTRLLNEQAQRSTIEYIGNAASTSRQLGLLQQQTDAAHNSVKAIQKQTRETERAWVGIDEPIKIDAMETMPNLRFASHYRIKNFGHGPARKVMVNAWFLTDAKMYLNLGKSVCKMSIPFSTGTVPHGPKVFNPGPMGYTLFPGQTHEESEGSPTSPWQGAGIPNLEHFWIIGCISYVDQFRQVHWTKFCMEHDRLQPIDRRVPLTFCSLYNETDASQ